MIVHKHILKDIGRIVHWYPVRWCVNLAPLSLIYWIGGLVGLVDFHVSRTRQKQKMMNNVSLALGPERDAAAIVRENFKNHSRNNLEFMTYPHLSPDNIGNYVSFDGIEVLDKELSKGCGVLLATAHFSAKQALQVGLGHKGYRVNQIHFHMGAEELTFVQRHVSQRWRKKIESMIPVRFMSAEGFMRATFECLRKKEILLVAGDGIGLKTHMNDTYAPFNFLGQKMLFPTGLVSLAKRTGASIVPVFTVRHGARHTIVFEPSLDMTGDDSFITASYVRILEKYVRQYPELWEFWEEFDEENLLCTK